LIVLKKWYTFIIKKAVHMANYRGGPEGGQEGRQLRASFL